MYYISVLSDEAVRLCVLPQYFKWTNDFKTNNIAFDNLCMTECWCTINGVSKPHQHYAIDFTKKEYNRLCETSLGGFFNNNNIKTVCMIDYLNLVKYILLFVSVYHITKIKQL